ncbi:hypothetical protein [uncultured Bacteroides sp.]|uniref:hypothetical protein n=1 Tax=uncultured Bacteroides sp. TaxID=162156 RepID=UPI002AA85438|nr:hypothetical protein [uncultured Bacteroides sp.]
MKLIFILIFALISFSCNAQINGKSKAQIVTTDSNLVPDSGVALQFINEYVTFCSQQISLDSNWIKKNQLLTGKFKTTYNNLINSAIKSDPEIGLDFDPILDAQDYPEQGFELVNCDNKAGFITLKGKDWPDFLLVIKVVRQDNKWLVDGSGVINIPLNKRAER